ncbi:jg14481 [Pararge aegeria aegeria]|uniref:Jg14481 protein n=1 Tax=Pararge aegeria aegeria TaxID=348720 RepID=A0A8S4RW65_9NEOP|nr:jg14481 [Pararge aegeria aegeria]
MRSCWRASELGSRKSLNPRALRSVGIVGLRAPHVRPNLGSSDDWSERVSDGESARLRGRGVSPRPDDVRSRGPRLRWRRRFGKVYRVL